MINNIIQPGDLIESIILPGNSSSLTYKGISIYIVLEIKDKESVIETFPPITVLIYKCLMTLPEIPYMLNHIGEFVLSRAHQNIEEGRWIVHKAFRNK